MKETWVPMDLLPETKPTVTSWKHQQHHQQFSLRTCCCRVCSEIPCKAPRNLAIHPRKIGLVRVSDPTQKLRWMVLIEVRERVMVRKQVWVLPWGTFLRFNSVPKKGALLALPASHSWSACAEEVQAELHQILLSTVHIQSFKGWPQQGYVIHMFSTSNHPVPGMIKSTLPVFSEDFPWSTSTPWGPKKQWTQPKSKWSHMVTVWVGKKNRVWGVWGPASPVFRDVFHNNNNICNLCNLCWKTLAPPWITKLAKIQNALKNAPFSSCIAVSSTWSERQLFKGDNGEIDFMWRLLKCFPSRLTPWKFNIAPEKRWLEDYFPFGMVHFQGLC